MRRRSVPRFEVIDHTADAGIVAYGRDLEEAFANAAYGMFSLVTDLDQVREDTSLDIEVEAADRETLLVSWLNELLYVFEVEHFIPSRFDIARLDQDRLEAKVYGERIDLSRHQLNTAIKGATYHMLKIEEQDGVKAQFILDI
jgi:SHS2 domain-containing protein